MKNIFAIIAVFAFAKAYAQDLTGIVTYQSQRSVDIKLGEGMDSAMQKQIQEQLKKQFQKTYTLKFKGSESIYTEDEAGIAPPQPSSSGMSIMLSGNTDVTYRNIAADKFVRQSEIMGKSFLIKDSIPTIDWKLEKEVKNIGQHTCFKATYTEEYEERTMSDIASEDKEEVTKKIRTTTAWYTLDIPLGHGPDRYAGLPGLILEINDGKFSLMCTKVVLKPQEDVGVVAPSKGKVVTNEEYNKIAEEKTKEMMERYSGGSKKGDNSSYSIRIGG